MSQVNDDEKSAEKAPSPTKSDEQAYLEEASINEKSLIRKLDRKLLPAVTILYLLSFLDRSNVGNARIEGLTEDLHMSKCFGEVKRENSFWRPQRIDSSSQRVTSISPA